MTPSRCTLSGFILVGLAGDRRPRRTQPLEPHLDATRSSAGARDNAAPGYNFTLAPGQAIRWEIPAIKEVVTGNTDGTPMVINRAAKPTALTLAVLSEGDLTLHYKVARNGQPAGAGAMTLIEGGKAWVDISWQAGKQLYAGELVYVRRQSTTGADPQRG
jgi:hypothetical protein